MAVNLPSVTVSQFLEIIENQYQEGIKRPIFGLGKGGIGKTESIEHLAKKLGIGYVDIRLLLYAETDLKGIPYPNKDGNKTIWLQNNILPTAERNGEKGLLVFDEITSSSRSVRTAAYQLLNERRLGEYELPDGWMVVCLGNGEEDGGDFQGMEGNFANRCSVFNVVPNLESWKEWAYQNGVNYMVTSYVSWQPQNLHSYDPAKENEILFASPRSWKAVSDILNSHPYNKNDELLHARILSNIGILVGQQFIAFCNYKDSAVDPADILRGDKIREINNMEVLFMTIHGVIKLIVDEIKQDKQNKGMITGDTLLRCANMFNWIFTLGKLDHQVMAINDFVKFDRAIASRIIMSTEFNKLCPKLREFSTKNKHVLSSK